MICPHCGKPNDVNQNYCCECGAALPEMQTQRFDSSNSIKPPKPYAWASPSSPLHAVVNEPEQVQPLQPLYSAPPAQFNAQSSAINHVPANSYHCPNCGTNAPPILRSKISDGGWLVFVLMLVFCFPLFWIGFLMRQQYSVCPACLRKLS
jgi:lipopolysaccharide-induced tumor necrosis factor-alpha factor